MPTLRSCLFAFAALVLAATPARADKPPRLDLVESWPIETTLDHADIPDAGAVWLEMIAGAKKSLELGEFYFTSQPGSSLEPVLKAVEAAAARGVNVRILADAKFAKREAATLARLEANPKIAVRRYDMEGLTHGVLHAKYFLVDRKEVFFGSQNFDWRALTHIQELGIRTDAPDVVHALADVWDTDWAIAGGGDKTRRVATPNAYTFPEKVGDVSVSFVASPKGLLPDESMWDLPRLVAMIDGAKKSVRVQVLTYQAIEKEGTWDELEAPLRRAAARGVEVELLVADWSRRVPTLDGLKTLAAVPHVHVKMMAIPPWSGGNIPFARVVHAKYMVVDGERAWVGTSNWEKGYFYGSRNVGIIVEGKPFAERLDRFFTGNFAGTYAVPVTRETTVLPKKD
jgi:phosphatidylserine/phosphatidylglycerophosphate/cardiolipin synthase-like enzyme